jgi:hypothetical protein
MKRFETDIRITGSADQASLANAVNLSTRELAKLQNYAKSLNSLMAKSQLAANGIVPKASEISKSTNALGAFMDRLRGIQDIAVGVGIGSLIAKGFDVAISAAERLRDVIGESIQKAADFQRTQEQLGIEMGVGMDSPQAKELLSKLQYYSDTSPFKMAGVTESIRMLLSSGFKPDQAMNVLKEIGDVAAATTPSGMGATEHLQQLNEAVNKAIKGGALLERTLYMFEDAGVQICPFLEKKLGMDPGSIGDLHDEANQTALAKQIKKRNVSSNLILDFLAKVTGKGGKYEEGAYKMSHDFLGAQSTLTDKIGTFMRGVGEAFTGPLTQLMNRINDSFNWDRFKNVQRFFDEVAAKSSAAFKPFIDKLANANWDSIGKDAEKALDKLGKMFNESLPILDKIASQIPQDIDAIVRITTAIEGVAAAIERAFNWVLGITGIGSPSATDQKSADLEKARKFADKQAKASANLPHFASGGIVTDPTVGLIGDAGPEAVIPLSALSDNSYLMQDSIDTQEKLNQTINKLILRLSGQGGSGGFSLSSGYSGGGSNERYTEFGPGSREINPEVRRTIGTVTIISAHTDIWIIAL